MSPRALTRLFLVVATAEAVSWAGLLTGMYVKYLTEAGDLGVRAFGPIHGTIFVGYVVLTLLLARALRWGPATTAVALVCSVPRSSPWSSRSGPSGPVASAYPTLHRSRWSRLQQHLDRRGARPSPGSPRRPRSSGRVRSKTRPGSMVPVEDQLEQLGQVACAPAPCRRPGRRSG